MILGIACLCLSQFFDGSNLQDFMPELLLGISIVEMLVGIFITMKSISKQ